MAEKNIKTRIIHKHDTEENWNKATNFIPKQGEIIVYDIDSSHSYERIKVGDGTTNVNSLPYVNGIVVDAELSETSENPVQNKTVKAALDKKIDEPSANGLVRKLMSGVYDAAGVDTTMPDSPTNGSVPTTKLLKDYVEDNTSNPLKLSDANLQKSGLLAQSYQAAGSTPGTVGTTTYAVVTRDTSTLDDTISGVSKVPSSYAVGKYVMEAVAFKADASNPLELSDTDKTKAMVLIQHNYDSETQTDKYIGRSIDTNNLSESGLAAYNIPTSKAVISWVKAYVENTLRGSKSGEGFLINDVSPVDHEMGVKISSDTVEDLTAVKVRKQGKNLIPFPYYRDLKLGTTTANGVDFTVYADGSILINGTAISNTTRYLYKNETDLLGLKSGITISVSKNESDNTQQDNVYFICNYYDSAGKMQSGIQASINASGKMTITDDWKGLGIYLHIPSGKTLNNLLIKPQLEIGATATEYESYITPTEYIPAADGTVNGITSLYPNTTLTTDTDGVIINCKYNRDINKAFAALEAAIATNNS